MTKKRSILPQDPLSKLSKRILSISVLANGSNISKEVRLLKLEAKHSLNQIPKATLEIADPDFQWCDSPSFLPGVELKINVGNRLREKEIFMGIITSQTMKHTGSGNLLVLELQDPGFALNSTKKASMYNEMKDAEIVSAIINHYPKLQVEVENTSNIPHNRTQANCSDWNFILEIAKDNGWYVLLKSGKITLKQLNLNGNAVSNFGKNNIYDYNLKMDSSSLSEKVKGKVWNYQEQITEEASYQLDDGLPKELAELIANPDFELLENQYDSLMEMSSSLQNKLSESIFSVARGSLKILGTADIHVGDIIELTDFSERMSGKTIVTGISHLVVNSQWHTELEIGLSELSDGKSNLNSYLGLHIGIVNALEGDPLQQNRIKIKFPLIGLDDEGIWARICLPDAGNLRGFHFMPEIGDEVVVSFLEGGFKNPIILGALHSSKNPAPISQSDDNNLKGIFTRNKLKLIFDDDEKSILLETEQGNRIKLSDENQINVEDSSGNKITLDQDGITIESIKDLTLKAGGDLNLTGININAASAASLKLIGSAGAELSSSASTVVKGAIVQIN